MSTSTALFLSFVACSGRPDAHVHEAPPPPTWGDTAGEPERELYDPPVRPGYDLPAGSVVQRPLDPALGFSFAYVDGAGGAPIIKYGADPGFFNVRRVVKATEVRQTLQGQYADLDLGPLRVRVANYAIRSSGFPVMKVEAASLAGLVVLRSYSRHQVTPGAPPAAALDMVSVLPAGSTSPLATFDLAAHPDVQLSSDCEALAWDQASEVPSMVVDFPPFNGCSLQECVDTKAAWIRGWHDVWRIRQMIEYMSQRDPEVRAFLWSQPAVDYDGQVMDEDTSLAWWFGDFAEYRFDAIRWAYGQLWDDMHDHMLLASQLDFDCTPTGAGDICNTTSNIPAHHAVFSNIKVCTEFWDESEDYRALLMVHEPLHHMLVPWNDNTPRVDPIMDTHTHGHGLGCGIDPQTNKGYGIEAIRHLATYENSNDFHCYHKNYAFRNNDSYAWAARTIGAGVRRGAIHHWPAEHWPPGWEPSSNPALPGCSEAGFDPPPPGSGWEDPLSGCHKIGQELVCPPGGSGVGAGHLPDFDLTVDCPPEW